MPLFHPRIIEKYTKLAKVLPSKHVEILNAWAENLAKGVFERETSHDSEFIQRILIDVLGYKGSSTGYQCTVGKNVPVGRGNVDTALGYYSENEFHIIAPFELKGAKTRDLDAIMPGRNKSPVQQAWEYGMDAKGAKWVLVSNYREIRLYAIGYGRKDYEVFDLTKLTDPYEYCRFTLLLSATNLLGDGTTNILKESENKNKEITDRFYKDYKALRGKMIDTLTKDNPAFPTLEIIQYTQTILDRILFVAFAADRGLLPKGTLKSCFEDTGKWNPQPAWENFKGLFSSIDKGNPPLNIPGYNGGLFAHNVRLDNLKVSDVLCEGFKTIGEYDFDSDVSVNILGHIFEQSITDLEEIKATIGGSAEELDSKKSKRKKDGIFYTPPYITRYIVEQAVGGWLSDRKQEIGFDKLPELTDEDYDSIQLVTRGARKGTVTYSKKIEQHIKAWTAYKQILSHIKVLDPACGSGAFLNEVFDYLYREGQTVNNELATLNAGQTQLFRWDTHILANNIYGVDINQESVEITKLSLWLKTANRNEKLTYLDNNIKCGNSLIDDSTIANDLAFKWENEFLEIMKAGKFDVVVGNPPYVFGGGSGIISTHKDYFKRTYVSASKKLNLFTLFIEKGVQLIKQGGYLCFIIPNTFLRVTSYSDSRKFILENTYVRSICELEDGVFGDAVTTAIIMNIQRLDSISKMIAFKKGVLGKEKVTDQSQFHNQGYVISTNLNDASVGLINKLQQAPLSLGDIAEEIIFGVVIAHNLDELVSSNYKTGLKPFLEGKDIARYIVKPVAKYLDYSPEKIHRPRTKAIFEVNEKILVQRITGGERALSFAYDNQQYYNKESINNIILKNGTDAKFILAVLNSKLINWFYVIKFTNSSKLTVNISKEYLSQIPIQNFKEADKKSLAEKAEVMLNKNKDLLDVLSKLLVLLKSEFGLEKPTTKLEQWYLLNFTSFIDELAKNKITLTLAQKAEWMEYFEKQKATALALKSTIDQTDRDIDQMVYALYGLTPEEITIIESADQPPNKQPK